MSKRKDIYMIVDRSGSMQVQREKVISGFNEYIDTIRQEPKTEITVVMFPGYPTIARQGIFSNRESTYIPYREVPVNAMGKLDLNTYRPEGNTPLFDAIGQTLEMASLRKRGDKLIIIITDGMENASTRWTNVRQIASMLDEKQAKGWGIIFLGANIDSFSVGATLGVARGNTGNFNPNDMRSAFAMAAVGTQSYFSVVESGEYVVTSKTGKSIRVGRDSLLAEAEDET